MIIGHFKKTPIANAPESICEIINKYTEHDSYVFGYGYPKKNIAPNTDIIHQHNKNEINFSKKIIQYHSEPFRVNLDNDLTKLVIAQYHATLPEYKNCIVVRNPIDLYSEYFIPKYYDKKIKIGYSPSTLTPLSIWADKGYSETVPILKNIKERYKNNVEIDIITNVSLDECLRRKSLCNIFIDEVKTISYHRSGLESLGMGIATICYIGKDVENVMLKSSQASTQPFINVYYDKLEKKLIELIDSGLNNLLEIGYASRFWMQTYWDPKQIANEYIKIYEKI